MMTVSGRRPKPFILEYTRFWWDGVAEGRLLIQRCADCGTLRHPPAPSCAACQSLRWDAIESAGIGTVYSFVVSHHPEAPGFEYPLVVLLVELDEGIRLVAGTDLRRDEVAIGDRVRVDWLRDEDGAQLPYFRRLEEEGGR